MRVYRLRFGVFARWAAGKVEAGTGAETRLEALARLLDDMDAAELEKAARMVGAARRVEK